MHVSEALGWVHSERPLVPTCWVPGPGLSLQQASSPTPPTTTSVWKQKWKEWYLPELSLMPLNITEVSELHKGSVWTLQTKVIPTASVLSSPVTLVRFPLHSHKPRALRLVFQHPAVLQS